MQSIFALERANPSTALGMTGGLGVMLGPSKHDTIETPQARPFAGSDLDGKVPTVALSERVGPL
jgi:hypothetical protein